MELTIITVKNGWIINNTFQDKDFMNVFVEWDDVVRKIAELHIKSQI